jgi:hypothetical protein
MAFSLSANVSASEILTSHVTKLMIDKNHGTIVFIKTDGTSDRTPGAGCHTNPTWDYVANLADATGEEIYSILLAAKTAQQEVSLRGKGQSVCDLYNGVETLRRVEY